MLKLILLIFSYVFGSIPFGFLVTYSVRNIDIRNFGSGNTGATNVSRVIGKNWGIFVFCLDFCKGFIVPLMAKIFIPEATDYFLVITACLTVCGHNWSIFLKFKGGKGVATSLGALVALSFVYPNLGIGLILAIICWVVIFYIFHYVSLASICASLVFLIFTFVFFHLTSIKLIAILLFVFILIRHKANIKRLLDKKESRF